MDLHEAFCLFAHLDKKYSGRNEVQECHVVMTKRMFKRIIRLTKLSYGAFSDHDLDILFLQVKYKGVTTITYEQFSFALEYIAMKRKVPLQILIDYILKCAVSFKKNKLNQYNGIKAKDKDTYNAFTSHSYGKWNRNEKVTLKDQLNISNTEPPFVMKEIAINISDNKNGFSLTDYLKTNQLIRIDPNTDANNKLPKIKVNKRPDVTYYVKDVDKEYLNVKNVIDNINRCINRVETNLNNNEVKKIEDIPLIPISRIENNIKPKSKINTGKPMILNNAPYDWGWHK